MLSELPFELILHILKFNEREDILKFRRLNKYFNDLVLKLIDYFDFNFKRVSVSYLHDETPIQKLKKFISLKSYDSFAISDQLPSECQIILHVDFKSDMGLYSRKIFDIEGQNHELVKLTVHCESLILRNLRINVLNLVCDNLQIINCEIRIFICNTSNSLSIKNSWLKYIVTLNFQFLENFNKFIECSENIVITKEKIDFLQFLKNQQIKETFWHSFIEGSNLKISFSN